MTDLRASDADREHAVAALRRHADEGRLDTDELEERIGRAYGAKTVGELAALHADLPPVGAPAPAPAPPDVRTPMLPGTAPFAARWRSPRSLQATMGALISHLSPAMHAHGYHLVERDAVRLRFEWERRPVWTFVVAVAVFPLGLLALLHKARRHVSVDLVEDAEGTQVVAGGTAPLGVRRAFAELEQ